MFESCPNRGVLVVKGEVLEKIDPKRESYLFSCEGELINLHVKSKGKSDIEVGKEYVISNVLFLNDQYCGMRLVIDTYTQMFEISRKVEFVWEK